MPLALASKFTSKTSPCMWMCKPSYQGKRPSDIFQLIRSRVKECGRIYVMWTGWLFPHIIRALMTLDSPITWKVHKLWWLFVFTIRIFMCQSFVHKIRGRPSRGWFCLNRTLSLYAADGLNCFAIVHFSISFQQIAFKNLIERNRRIQQQDGPPPENSSIQLPFIIVNTSKKTVIDCSISNDK